MEKEGSASIRPPTDDNDATQMFGGSTEMGEDEQGQEEAPETSAEAEPDEKPAKKVASTQVAGKSAHAAQVAGKGGARTQVGGAAGSTTQAPGGTQATGPTTGASMLGKYKLLKKLGQGGMGAVYKAEHSDTHEIVAIKVLSKELAAKPAFVQRFQREARVMQKIDHPNVLTCLDVGEAKGYHFLALEFVEGGSVENWLKKLGHFSLPDALYIFLKCAEALGQAHSLSLVHRDVKPDNILLTKDGQIKVADLGLAKDTEEDQNLTRTGTGAGTPIYMAPEQARDVKHVDGKVDIYALGVMLYVFLTGEAPFKGNTLVELIAAKETGKFKPMRTFNAEVPERLDLLVDKMLAKDPKHRFQTCQEVIDQVEPLALHGDGLSFFRPQDEDDMVAQEVVDDEEEHVAAPTNLPKKAAATKIAGTSVGGKMGASTQKPRSAGTTAPDNKTAIAPPKNEPKLEPNVWFMEVKMKGKTTTQRITTGEVLAGLKNGAVPFEANLSKSPKGPFRAVGTYQEFTGIVRDLQTKKSADKKGATARDKYKEIQAAYDRQQKWKWLSRLLGGGGKALGGILWIALIFLILGGAAWYVYTFHRALLPF